MLDRNINGGGGDLTQWGERKFRGSCWGLDAFTRIRLVHVHTSLERREFHSHASLRELFWDRG